MHGLRGNRPLSPGARAIAAVRRRGTPVVLAAILLWCLGGCQRRAEDAPQTTPGAASSSPAPDALAAERRRMAEILAQILSRGGELPPASRRVLEAMARVPRHEFVPPDKRLQAYDVRTPLSIAENQTISSPECVAIMTAALRLEGGEKVLEIGTGSGYQAAILGELAAQVYSIEIRPGLAESARKRLQELKAAGAIDHRKLEVVVGNGYQGYEAAAPFDAIIVTAAPREVPVELLNQLAPGGRMVIPVGDFYQRLQVIERRADGSLTHSVNETVRFVPMVGEDEVR